MRQSVEEAILNLCLEKHGDTEIQWTGIAENYNSLDNVKTCFEKFPGDDLFSVKRNGLMLSTFRKKID